MKKILALTLSLIMVMTLFTACSSSDEKVKTGLAVITSISDKSKDATAEADGLAQADSTAVAVLVDSKGVIKNIVIDVVQTKVNFNTAGEITTDFAQEYVSKHELGDAYNMKGASAIGKEWFEQAHALADYVTGKKLEDVKKIALDGGYPTDADLTSSVTMNIGEILNAIESSKQCQDLGAIANKLGLGVISNLGKSANAVKDSLTQAYTHYMLSQLTLG